MFDGSHDKLSIKTNLPTSRIILFMLMNFAAGFGICQALHNLGVLS